MHRYMNVYISQRLIATATMILMNSATDKHRLNPKDHNEDEPKDFSETLCLFYALKTTTKTHIKQL